MYLKITVNEKIDHEINVFLNNENLGIITNELHKEMALDTNKNTLYFTYSDKKSNVLELKNSQEDQSLEISKAFSLKQIPPSMILRVLLPLFMMCFCFHKALGIGYYLFGIVSILLCVMLVVNKNKLVIRPVKK